MSDLSLGLSPLPVRVTTRIITFLVGNPYKPSFPLLLGGGTTQLISQKILQSPSGVAPIPTPPQLASAMGNATSQPCTGTSALSIDRAECHEFGVNTPPPPKKNEGIDTKNDGPCKICITPASTMDILDIYLKVWMNKPPVN